MSFVFSMLCPESFVLVPSLRSRRQRKAWGASPGKTSKIIHEPVKRATADRLSCILSAMVCVGFRAFARFASSFLLIALPYDADRLYAFTCLQASSPAICDLRSIRISAPPMDPLSQRGVQECNRQPTPLPAIRSQLWRTLPNQ